MIGALRSEFRKFFTTNFWWMMCLAIFLVAATFAGLFALFVTMAPPAGVDTGPEPTPLDLARNVYGGPVNFGYLLSLVAGVLTMGSELRHKTVTSTFLSTPNRAVVMAAKVVSQLVTGFLMGLAYVAGALVGGGAVLAWRGKEVFPDPTALIGSLLLAALVIAIWSLIGLGLGILMPMVAAIITGIAVAFIVEPLLGSLLATQDWGKDIAPYLPSSASMAMMQYGQDVAQQPGMPQLLSWWQGALVLGAYGLVFALIGTVLMTRRDIS